MQKPSPFLNVVVRRSARARQRRAPRPPESPPPPSPRGGVVRALPAFLKSREAIPDSRLGFGEDEPQRFRQERRAPSFYLIRQSDGRAAALENSAPQNPRWLSEHCAKQAARRTTASSRSTSISVPSAPRTRRMKFEPTHVGCYGSLKGFVPRRDSLKVSAQRPRGIGILLKREDRSVAYNPLFADAPLALSDEFDQVPQFGRGRQLRFDPGQGVGNGQPLAEENFISLLQRSLHLLRNSVPVQSDLVYGSGLGGVTVGQHEWRHVLDHFRAAANDRHFSDATELMHRGQAADHGIIFDDDMARQGGDVGHDHVIAQGDIVRDVGIGQDVIGRTHSRHLALARGAMDRYMFAERVVVANFGVSRSSLPFQVLCFQPETGERKYFVPPAEGRVSFHDDMRVQPATRTQYDTLADNAIRSNLAVIADYRLGMNDGGRMDHIHLSIRQDEGDFGLTDHLAVDGTDTLGFADFPPGIGQLDVDHKGVTRALRFAPLYILGGH